ncbi:MAG: PilZ domain-containing protein [Acidobacteriota bacterium]
MCKKRIEKRLNQQNEVTITVVSDVSQSPAKRVSYNLTKDISASGVKLVSNCFLPKGALLKINLTLNNPPQMIRVLGKVQWSKSILADELFEVGSPTPFPRIYPSLWPNNKVSRRSRLGRISM